MKAVLLTLAAVAFAAILAGSALVGGLYDISATDQHLRPTYWAIDTASRRSVKVRARSITPPKLDEAARVERGLALFRDHCVQCHGAPGVAPAAFAFGMTPAPANLVDTGRTWSAAEIYWTVRNGFKMTGMPAWRYRMADEQLWDVVAFVATALPRLSPVEYRKRAEAAPAVALREDAPTAADAKRGKDAIQQFGCPTCHAIPGIVGANKPVGPPLEAMAKRAVIAGIAPNTRENLEQFLLDPHSVSPESAMPKLGLRVQDARDIAAYLSTLR
ncbi:MAG TPA: c-type cytochrome [Usitatibacter sp.]|nr:c-type cytochrome [Usitatibacter sp.]